MTHPSQQLITSVLRRNPDLANNMSLQAFAQEQQIKGEQVSLYRDYQNGEHRNFLTEKQRKLINLPPAVRSARDQSRTVITSHDFNANYCDKIVSAVTSRTQADSITAAGEDESATETLNEWLTGTMEFNRFDSLQGKIYRAAYGDRSSFVLAEWDSDNEQTQWTAEPSYNGSDGMIVKYAADNKTILFAIKIWHLADEHGALSKTRINVYYPDRIERYVSVGRGAIHPLIDEETETHVTEWNLGVVPIASFINRRVSYTADGKSEIEDIIGLQDALNYALYSLTASATLSGFGVWKAIGFQIPSEIQPGMVFLADRREKNQDGVVTITPPLSSTGSKTYFPPDLERISGDGPTPYVEQANWIIEQIAVITETPIPKFMGGSGESGEALKQRESGLVAKVKEAQINFGAAWEDLVKISHAIHNENSSLPDLKSVSVRWSPSEIRSESDVVESIIKLKDAGLIDQKTALESVAFAFGWSEDDITNIVERTQAANNALLFGNGALIPGLGFG
jgi:hypothetical protein